jgi:hypothetical protein
MSTVTMPGFTAEMSLFNNVGFGKVGTILFQNTMGRVEPAMRLNCDDVGALSNFAYQRGRLDIANFWYGVGIAMGC